MTKEERTGARSASDKASAAEARRAALIAAGRSAMRGYARQNYLDFKEKYETNGN